MQTDNKIPTISILLPMFSETNKAPQILSHINNLYYPEEALKIYFIIEQDDLGTLESVMPYYNGTSTFIIKVPYSMPRTKPKAMNIAMPFIYSDIIGIYDAEDQPEPYQLMKVAQAMRDNPQISAVHAKLAVYNSSESWISKCFTIEYATWFSFILPAMIKLNFPVPLGGSSVFIRREILMQIGLWDAYNVTEDADLGVRLYRNNKKWNFIESVTLEEAPISTIAWIKQRSRWQKGYIVTWWTHTHTIKESIRDMGITGFILLQVTFLLPIISYVAKISLWGILINISITQETNISDLSIAIFIWIPIFLVISIITVFRNNMLHLSSALLLMPVYWLLSTISAFIAIVSMVINPSYWSKTQHGVSEMIHNKQSQIHTSSNPKV